jgi:hypothetical protein
MIDHRQFPTAGIKVEEIVVERCRPDFNDPGWQTFTLLLEGLPLDHPGPDEVISLYFRLFIGRVVLPGTVYANPCGVVRSPKADHQFFKLARQMQSEWYGQFNKGLASAERVRRRMSELDPLIRQLTHTGVLFIDNHHVFPDRWPDRSSKPSRDRERKRTGNQGS